MKPAHKIDLIDNEYVYTYLEFVTDITPFLHLTYNKTFSPYLFKWTKGFLEGLLEELGVFDLPYLYVVFPKENKSGVRLAEKMGFQRLHTPAPDEILMFIEV